MDTTGLSNLISTLNLNAAGWYQTATGAPAVSNLSAANLVAGSVAQQTSFAAANPTIAGLLGNPGFLIIILLGVVALIFVLRK